MILLLGGTGYIGQAFADELRRRDRRFFSLSRKELDYTRFDCLLPFVQAQRPELVINAAGYAGKPNVDACETARAETLLGNAVLPQTIAHVCAVTGTAWGHVSSGCIYSGAKVKSGNCWRIEPNLTQPDLRRIVETERDAIRGFTEEDPPNFSFRSPPCSFYSGTKALAEELLASCERTYIWRLRIPFDGVDHSKNYLSKLQRYPKVYDNVNSLSHRADFVRACLDLWESKAPYGIYNVTNPGFVTARQVTELIRRCLQPSREFEFWKDDDEFYATAATAPRSNCVLDVQKLLSTGVRMRPVTEALEQSLRDWIS